MRVISVPIRLRVVTGLMGLCIPIAALQSIVVTRAPWWQLPYRTIEIWSVAVALICIPLVIWMIRGKKWALSLCGAFAVFWCTLSAWVAYRTSNPSLGFFTLFLTLFWSGLFFWLKYEMGRSFFDPQLCWYQTLPQAIPGVKCSLQVREGERVDFRVSRLDLDGTFVFSDAKQVSSAREKSVVEMIFTFREHEVRCHGTLIRSLQKNSGAGFQFQKMTPDAQKKLGDFVEVLRGEGHVQ